MESGIDDSRRLCAELLRRLAAGGYAFAQVVSRYERSDRGDADEVALLERAVAQGEPFAFYGLAGFLFAERDRIAGNDARAARLWLAGALLGDARCQLGYALNCCAENSLARFQWMRRAALQERFYWCHIVKEAEEQVALYDQGASGRIMYDIGTFFAGCEDIMTEAERVAFERAIALHTRCNEEAKRAVLCWLWLARKKKVIKDIRRLIADLIWDERAAWSERLRNVETSGGLALRNSERKKQRV